MHKNGEINHMQKKSQTATEQLTDEQIAKSEKFISEMGGEKIELRIPRWINQVLENDIKTYFNDSSVTRNTIATAALCSFNAYLSDERDKTRKLIGIADFYAENKYGCHVGESKEDNFIANLTPQDFIYLDSLNGVFNPSFDSDESVKLRITPTKQNAWILSLYKSSWEEGYAGEKDSLTKQLSRVLAWYASFPGFKREQILKQDVYADTKKVIAGKSERGRFYDCYMESGKVMVVCPYKLAVHKENIHNYLVGVGDEQHYAPVSLRLDRISKIVPNYSIPVKEKITDEEKNILDSMIKYAPEFAYPTFSKPATIIRLSEHAQALYSKVYIHRPTEIAKSKNLDGTMDYTYDCTETQLCNYFKKFDAEFEIVQSETLKDQLIAFHQSALKMLG